jgi:HK97 family phage major capsid protein
VSPIPASDFSTNSFGPGTGPNSGPPYNGVPTTNTFYRGLPGPSGGSSEIFLPPEVSGEIWQRVFEQSIVAQLARQVPITAPGQIFPIINGVPTADWVGETQEKPLTKSGVGSKFIKPYKIATVMAFSKEFKRDIPSLYNAFVNQLPLAIANKFDQTVFFGPSPGTGFDTLTNIPTIEIARNVPGDATTLGASYRSLLGALATVATNWGEVDAWVINSVGEIQFLSELDSLGRPYFSLTPGSMVPSGAIGSMLGRPVYRSRHVTSSTAGSGLVDATHVDDRRTVGFAGDWSNAAVWGQIGGIQVSMSEHATINDGGTLINLFQRNMFAVLVETELVFGIKSVDPTQVPFVRLVHASTGGATGPTGP